MCNFITLRASGGGAVYCNRSCLCVMVVVTMMVRSSLCHTVLSHSDLVTEYNLQYLICHIERLL